MSYPEFRAWAIAKQEFIEDVIHDGESWLEMEGYETLSLSEIFDGDEFIVEQDTGLKDKNGIKIRVGDIVRTKSPDRANFSAGAIEMVQQMFLIMNSAHYSDPEISHCEPLGYYCDTELEVIGNIHENSELLEQEVR